MQYCNGTKVPGEAKIHLTKVNNNEDLLDEKIPYKEAVGSLLYVSTNTRPDISYYVSQVSRFCAKPGKIHWEAIKRILRYLKHTSSYKLKFDGNLPFRILGYSDASFAQDPDTRKSTTGTLITLLNTPVMWRSKLQTLLASSTAEAEYIAMAKASKDIIWIRHFLAFLTKTSIEPIELLVDNQAAIQIGSQTAVTERNKHIDLRIHTVRDHVTKRAISLKYCPTKEQAADLLTKSLSWVTFSYLLQYFSLSTDSLVEGEINK
jgi:hypothetical protein